MAKEDVMLRSGIGLACSTTSAWLNAFAFKCVKNQKAVVYGRTPKALLNICWHTFGSTYVLVGDAMTQAQHTFLSLFVIGLDGCVSVAPNIGVCLSE